MNVVLKTNNRHLLSFTTSEIGGVLNAINDICNGVRNDEAEFESRIGVTRSSMTELLMRMTADVPSSMHRDSRSDAWSDGASVQAICMTVTGDPVDMSVEEAKEFQKRLGDAIEEAERSR